MAETVGMRPLALALLSAATVLSSDSRAAAQAGAAASASTPSEVLPLAPLRPLSIAADEGTWISLDVSPDGRTIAFDLLGKLFTLPIDGGRATQVTWGPSFDEWPQFTRDGKHIVFSSDRGGPIDLWKVPVAGGVVVAAAPADRTGVRMALDINDTNADPATWTAQTRPVSNEATAAAPPEPLTFWSPDGRVGVRSSRRGDANIYQTGECRSQERASLVLVRRDTGQERTLADGGPDCMERVSMSQSAFTPDGSAFITAHGGKIWRISISSGEKTLIPFAADVAMQVRPRQKFPHRFRDDPLVHARVIEHARLSPDGKQVVFGAFDRVWIQGLPNGTPRRLTQLDDGEFQPVWSPDGSEVVFTIWNTARADGAIARVRLTADCASSGLCPVDRLTSTPSRYLHPAYSPDGKRVVAMQARLGGRVGKLAARFVSVPTADGPPEVFGPARDLNVEFSDLYFQPHDSQGVIEAVPLAERVPGQPQLFNGRCVLSRLSLHAGQASDPPPILVVRDAMRAPPPWQNRGNLNFTCGGALSPQGDRVVVRRASGELYLVDLPPQAGSAEQIVTLSFEAANRISPDGLGGDSPSWSADGRRISFTFGSTFYIYDLDKARTVSKEKAASATEAIRIDVAVPRNLPAAITLFRNARLITMRGDEVIEKGDVVVRGRRIAEIGRAGSVNVPAGARIVDADGLTIIPGLLDLHNHALTQTFVVGVHDSQNAALETNLAFGVLNSRDPQGYQTEILTTEDIIETGRMLGARTRNTFVGVGNSSAEWLHSLAHAREVVHRYGEGGLKVGYIKEYTSGPRLQRQYLAVAAAGENLNVTSHGTSLKQLLTNAIDGYGGFDHPIVAVPLYDDVLQLLVATQIPWADNNWRWALPGHFMRTLSEDEKDKLRRLYRRDTRGEFAMSLDERVKIFSGPENAEGDDPQAAMRMAESLVAALRKGARIVNGSHGDDVPGLGTHLQIWAYVDGGATPLEALRTSTLWAAEALDWGQDLGSLEVGKLADLLVLERNPLERIENTIAIRYVMFNGRLYEADTLREVSLKTGS